nr:MAG TPA: hypothetical protein [Bacteriophage sp.]
MCTSQEEKRVVIGYKHQPAAHSCISLTKLTADSEFSTYNIHMMYANFLHELTM